MNTHNHNRNCHNELDKGTYCPIPLNLQPASAHLNKPAGSFPVAEEMAKRVMSLPMGPDLACDAQQRVVDTLLKAAVPSEVIS